MRYSFFVLIITLTLLTRADDAYSRRGCCSWHGGISHCDQKSGKYECNDGTLSPSCYCSLSSSQIPKKLKIYKNIKSTNSKLLPLDKGLPVELSIPDRTEGHVLGPLNMYQNYPQAQSDRNKDKKVFDLKSIPYKKLTESIGIIKEKVCENDKTLKYEIWFSFGGTAGIFVSANSEAGMKVLIDCSLQE